MERPAPSLTSFQTEPTRGWMNTRAVEWGVGGKRVLHRITIPANRPFESSVPHGLQWLVDPDDPRLLLAALIHDWMLENGYGRTQAAAEWRDAAIAGGYPRRLANRYYLAVAWWAVYYHPASDEANK